ncbi:LPS assembly lipoprotein LptE [Pelagicoccus albus]|uniref:LPS-assembly lipoprotein n=1 Tax=Pelagicoccus albus TaxID=415222 RepID=A0A7X1B8K3_9BACT|nr:LPS assembly lipoprotein LptE [Pelagicoccus albus]MBC2607664.1 hypothetical protein [Pelagicoccus albus]
MRTLILCGAIVALLSGCASYQLGTPSPLPYETIAVAPPLNKTTLPQIEGPLNAALRQSLQRSSSVKLSTGSAADGILSLTLLEVKRSIAAVTSDDVGRGRKFQLEIQVELSVSNENDPSAPYLPSRVFAISQDIFTDDGQVEAEYQAIPEISRKIAEKTTELVTELWQ